MRWGRRMTSPVPGQEQTSHAIETPEPKLIGRRAPGCVHSLPGLFLETVDVIEPRSADDSDDWFGHLGGIRTEPDGKIFLSVNASPSLATSFRRLKHALQV